MQVAGEREPGADGALAWIGPRPTGLEMVAILTIGTMGMLICGVQPVLLGALLADQRLSAAELGWATTSEFLSLGVMITAAGAVLKPTHMRLKMAAAASVAIVADILVRQHSGFAVVLNRGVAGLAEGLMVWCAASMIARSSAPARWAAVFLTAQGVTQLAFAAAAPVTVIAAFGANGGFYAMAATAGLALLMVPFIPNSFVDLPPAPKREGSVRGYSAASLLSLASVFLIAAFSIGLFAYLAPVAAQAKIDGPGLGLIVSVVLATSVAGSTVAAFAAARISFFSVFVICLVVNAIVLLVLAQLPGLVPFAIAAGVFGFFWLLFLPFQLPFVIETDPTRRIAVIVPGAQLLGGSAGPLFCSFLVNDVETRGALVVCAICFGTAFLMSLGVHLQHLRTVRSAGVAPAT
ncbi:MFS transporter [Phenylobacterium sp.]|uniref:MFS transporter n=1 Tax=Phenylobacterium sp. TaxID=1871053 RepID=UPI002ED7CB5B